MKEYSYMEKILSVSGLQKSYVTKGNTYPVRSAWKWTEVNLLRSWDRPAGSPTSGIIYESR